MGRLSSGDYTHKSLLSELWRGIYHRCFAPRSDFGLFKQHHGVEYTVTCNKGCSHGDTPDESSTFWKTTKKNVVQLLKNMKKARFGNPVAP